jgi:hypothetical protein
MVEYLFYGNEKARAGIKKIRKIGGMLSMAAMDHISQKIRYQ